MLAKSHIFLKSHKYWQHWVWFLRTIVTIPSDQKPLEYFRAVKTKVRSRRKRLIILKQSIAYLAEEEFISLEILKLWCEELVKILDKKLTMRPEVAIIIYGFHTLFLKNHGKDRELLMLRTTLGNRMKILQSWNRVKFARYCSPVWYRGACFKSPKKIIFPIRD